MAGTALTSRVKKPQASTTVTYPVMAARRKPQRQLMEREARSRERMRCILTSCCRWYWPVRTLGGCSCRRPSTRGRVEEVVVEEDEAGAPIGGRRRFLRWLPPLLPPFCGVCRGFC